MKEYDLISIGTGSAMKIVDVMIQENVIDKDEPGGFCARAFYSLMSPEQYHQLVEHH